MTTILLVDDDALVLTALRCLLESVGYSVSAASSGGAGLKLYREKAPDLAIVDILMPGMDGIETIRQIRRIRPAQPIIAMSGGGRLDNPTLLPSTARLLDVPAVAKPIRNTQFLDAVGSALTSPGSTKSLS